MNKIDLRTPFVFFLFCMGLWSCADREEGCLDIEATNYNVTADDPCMDCCEYPDLTLSFSFFWDSLSYRNTELYTSLDQDVIQILDAQVLLSNFELRAQGQSIRVTDSIVLPLLVNGDELEQEFVDDFNRVSRQINFNYTLGAISSLQATIDSISFQIGLDPVLADIDTSSMPASHPLTNSIDDLYDAPGTGFQSIRFEVVTDTFSMNPDTLVYLSGVNVTRPVQLEVNQEVSRGFDFSVSIQIDYQKWLEGINFATDPETLIEEKLLENASGAFSIEQ